MNRYKNSNTSAADALHLLHISTRPYFAQDRRHRPGCFDPLCHSHDVDVIHSDMEEGSRAEGDDRRTDVGVGYDLNTKDVGDGAPGWRQ
jgi:hypothetical protein